MTTSNDPILSNLIAKSFYDLHCDIRDTAPAEVWCAGGRGSTKSSFISIQILLGLINDKSAHAFVSRRYDNELRDSVYGQMQWAADKLNLNNYWKFSVSPMQATNLKTNQKILFRGLDNPLKAKSISLGSGYIKYFWAEECDQFAGLEEIRNILQSLFRGAGKNQIAFFSFNPPKSARSWVNAEIKKSKNGRIVHQSDYRSVNPEWLGERFIADAEHLKTVNESAYRHEYLGEEIGTGLEVFNNVTLRDITDEEIDNFDQIRQGLDFGYAVDPLCFLRMNFNSKKRQLHIFREISGIGIGNRKFASMLTDKEKNITTNADSAEPKSIDELKYDYGLRIEGVRKGAGSIEHGIKWLCELESTVIDPTRCPLAAKEFINYALDINRNGDIISKYPDKENHCLIGRTRITTENGYSRIDEITPGTKVLTTKGLETCYEVIDNGICYTKALITKKGRVLIATGNHKIYVNNEFKTLDSIRYSDMLVINEVNEWKNQNKLLWMDILSEDGRNQKEETIECTSIAQLFEKDFTYIFGKNKTALFQKAVVFIILMAIHLIIKLKTCYVSIKKIICLNMSLAKNTRIGGKNGWTKLDRLLKNGIAQKREKNGIKSTAKMLCRKEKKKNIFAKFAERPFFQKIRNQNFAQTIVKQNTEERQALITLQGNVNIVVQNSQSTNTQKQSFVQDSVLLTIGLGKEKVFDINVENKHEFFAENILVHNSIDSTRYANVNDIRKISMPKTDVRRRVRI